MVDNKLTNNKSVKYWSTTDEINYLTKDSAAMGGGGIIEVVYRNYFEFRKLKKIINFNKKMTVLELGCGNGRWVISIAPIVKKYTAVDLSVNSIERLKVITEEKKIKNTNFVVSSIENFSSGDKYDVIYFSGVSQYLEDDVFSGMVKKFVKHNLNPYGVIIDRSTVSLEKRYRKETETYFAIYRTSQEIVDLFTYNNFKLFHSERSYRFLRAGKFYNYKLWQRGLTLLINKTKPISFYVMYLISFILDKTVRAKYWEKGLGYFSHDFFVFKNKYEE